MRYLKPIQLAVPALAVPLLLTATSDGHAKELKETSSKFEQLNRPRIGLALSGGGARGFSHVGVLRALEHLRIPVDCIAGTSAGSAVGAAYALGLTPDEIEAYLKSVDWDQDIFNDQPSRTDISYRAKERLGGAPIGITLGIDADGVKIPIGIFAGQKIELFLHRMLGLSVELDSFDLLPIPFRAITTNIVNGDMVVKDDGSLVQAVRASMAVPSAFSPVKSGDQLLVDGGLTQNLPVHAVRQACADVVIAVNIGSPLLKPEELDNIFSVALQIVSILMEKNVIESIDSLTPQDILITPNLSSVSAVDFGNGVKGIPAGESATLAMADKLQMHRLSESAYRQWQNNRLSKKTSNPAISRIQITETSYVNPNFFSKDDSPNHPRDEIADTASLEKKIMNWSASGDFTNISYSIRREEGLYTLKIDPHEKSWGPNFLQVGITGAVDSHSQTDFGVTGVLRRSWMNSYGAEWITKGLLSKKRQLESAWFQPLGTRSHYFLESKLNLSAEPIRVFADDKTVGEFLTERGELGLSAGIQSQLGKIQLGFLTGDIRRSSTTGFTRLSPAKAQYTGWRDKPFMTNLMIWTFLALARPSSLMGSLPIA